jgi:hypothetical protein
VCRVSISRVGSSILARRLVGVNRIRHAVARPGDELTGQAAAADYRSMAR